MTLIETNDVVKAHCAGCEEPILGDVLEIDHKTQRAYIRFRNQDKRLDAWIPFKEVTFVSKNSEKAATPRRRKKDSKGEEKMQEQSPIRNIDSIQYGDKEIDCWYYSPYLPQFTENRHLYVCDVCLRYFTNEKDFFSHGHGKYDRRPPGREIYRAGKLSMFEVAGAEHKIFCQCLSLLSKLFLDDVAVFYNVSQFVFFVLCECDEYGAHVVSFFSRDCRWLDNNILACILVLPPYQREGYGRLMISIAYEMARRIGINGGPEKPLSDLGKKAFTAYWKEKILETMFAHHDKIKCVDDFTTISSIAKADLLKTMKEMKLLYHTNEGWTTTLNIDAMKEWVEKGQRPKPPRIPFHPEMLIWLPDDGEDDENKP